MTSLHRTIVTAAEVLAKLPLEKGADVKATDSARNTPLDLAIQQGLGEIDQLLLNRIGEE